jgi:hypothetical protein
MSVRFWGWAMLILGSGILALLVANLAYALSMFPINQNTQFLQDNYYVVVRPSFLVVPTASLSLIGAGIWFLRKAAGKA